jgi:FPC/CPF motif-containing protein YcgG
VIAACDIRSGRNDPAIHRELETWVDLHPAQRDGFCSLAVIFREPAHLSELQFEHALWQRLQSLAENDAWQGEKYDASVSPDPDDPDFSVSFAGQAFFVVGLHPDANRAARRFAHPTMIFNLHAQFVRLRERQLYDRMRDQIIKRDIALCGSANPMLAHHGEQSAARQYSGRSVTEGWVCPFRDPRT